MAVNVEIIAIFTACCGNTKHTTNIFMFLNKADAIANKLQCFSQCFRDGETLCS
jgi:hypothetical protein